MALTPTRRKVVDVRPVPSGRADASHFGGLEGKALEGVGKNVTGAAYDIDTMVKKNDIFVSQKAYNAANEKALKLYSDASALSGENAIGVTENTEMAFKDIEQTTTEGMTQRQKNIFMQNWKPKSINYRQRTANHETKQLQAAQLQQMETTFQTELQEWVDIGSDEALAQAENSFRLYQKEQGSTSENTEMSWEGAKKRAEDFRFDKLVKAEEFDAAAMMIGVDPILLQNQDLDFVQRIFSDNPDAIDNEDGSHSTHRMATEVTEDGEWIVFPTIVNQEGKLVQKGHEDGEAMRHAQETGEYISFGKDKDAALEFGANGYKKGTPMDPNSDPSQKLRISSLKNGILSKENRLERESAQRLTQADARITEVITKENDPFFIPSMDQYNKLYSDPDIARAKHAERVALVEELRTTEEEPRFLDETTLNLAVAMAENPGNFSMREKMLMSYNLTHLKSGDPGVAGILSQINQTMDETASNGFVSPGTREKNTSYTRIFKLFDKANFKGVNAYGGEDPAMTTAGVVTTGGAASRQLSEWLQVYDDTVSYAKKHDLKPGEMDKLIQENVFGPLEYMNDKKMTKENNATWLKKSYRRLAQEPEKPDPEGRINITPDEAKILAEALKNLTAEQE